MAKSKAERFIDVVVLWARQQPQVTGLLLVGSYARGTARIDSDIDLVIFVHDTKPWLDDVQWLNSFGTVEKLEFEDWGGVKTQRATFGDAVEVEFNFTTPAWASVDPIDPGTFRVASDGAVVLIDPQGYLERLVCCVSKP